RTPLRGAEVTAPPSVPPKSRELRSRLWVGATLIVLACGTLFVDRFLPYYPCLALMLLVLGGLSAPELHTLLVGQPRAPRWLMVSSVLAVLLANWAGPVGLIPDADPWRAVAVTFAAVVLTGFLWEMATFREPGGVIGRIAALLLGAGYL